MARQVEDITVKLGIEGFEELNKLRGAFRELTRVTGATDTQLNNTRERLLELKSELGNTTRVNKGLTDAFSALLDEARRGSDVWQKLNKDLSDLRQESRLTDTQIQSLRKIILDEAAAHSQSATSIKEHIKSLQTLREQASLNGNVHRELSNDINKLTDTLKTGTKGNREHYKSLTQHLAVVPDKVLNAWNNYKRILDEGTASTEKLAVAQKRLNQLSGAPRILERRKITETASIRQDPEYIKRFATFEGKSLEEMPNVTAAWSQKLKELQQDLAFTTRNSVEYLSVAMRIAAVQRELAAVTPGFAQSLVMGLRTGTTASTAQNIREAITALRAEMEQLDTTTAEGSRHYVENASTARQLTQQLNRLGDSYRHVGDMAAQAATAEQNAANARIRNNYLNRGMVRQQEAALAELGQRVRAGVAGTPLLLPAAGQTSAPGTGAAISGGARRLVAGRTESVLGAPATRSAAQQTGLPSAAVGAPAAIGLIAEAYDRQAARAFKASESLDKYFVAISKATQESNNSINSLNKQRQAWEDLRNAIPRTYKLYEEASDKIREFDKQLERSQLQRRRLSGMQVAQGVGAAISGGIFGGPEGLVGGLAGLAVGGVGGAFAGAAIGAQAGMLRQQLGLVAQYVAQLNLAKTTLAQASTGQADYNNMLASARKISADYAVTLQDTLRGYAQVAVAARANGLSVKETEQVYRGVIAAGVAFGKSQTDLDAIVTATVQVLSKGKVSAEELSGQIGERLPGAVAKFAAATGRTLPELAKALQEGQVNISDFVKFAQQQFTDYDSIARVIGDSPEKAGARLRIALDTIAESYGGFLQNSGATFQDAAGHVLGWVIANENSIKRFLSALSLFGKDLVAILKPVAQTTISIFKPVFSFIFENAARGIAAIRTSIEALQQADYAGASARAQKAVEKLYPNPLERALKGAPAYQEALNVELQKMNKRFGSGYTDLLNAEAARLFKQFQPSQYGTPSAAATAATGAGTDAANKDKAAKKAKSDADSIAAHQQRLAETALEQQLRMEDTLYQHKIELDRKRYELQKNLDDLQAQNRIARETGATRDYLSKFYKLEQDLRAIRERRLSGEQAVEASKRAASAADARAALSGSGVSTALRGGVSSAPLFSSTTLAKATTEAAKFTGIANQCSNAVKAFYKSLGISLPGVTAWADSVNKAGTVMRDWSKLRPGDIVATGRPGDTPHVGVYTGGNNVFHQSKRRGLTVGNYPDLDYFKSGYFVRPSQAASSAKLPTGVGAQQIRAMKQGGEAGREQADVVQQKRLQQIEQEFAPKQELEAYLEFQLSVTENLRTANAELEDNNKLQALNNRLSMEGVSPERIELETKIQGKRLEQQRTAAGYEKAVALVRNDSTLSIEEQNAKIAQLTATQTVYNTELERLIQLYKDSAELAEARKSPVAIIGAAIETLKTEIADLTNIGNVAVSVAGTISSAFGTAFSNLMSGSMSVGEALGQMFKDIGNQFIQMAIQIISKQMTLIILQTIFNALRGGGGGFSFGGSSGGFDLPGFQMPDYMSGTTIPAPGTFAKGGAFGKNGIVPYANGGIVSRPTLFQFANGGTAATGLMGEAGPEAIMPLRRGPDGRLGVEANGLRQSMGPAPGLPQQSPVLNMSFETSTINGVEYVSREQLEAAMEQTRRDATRSGAQRGMTMTLDRLQQSPNTRRRVGI